MVWLHSFIIFWLLFLIVIAKWFRWFVEQDVEPGMKGIPFPMWVHLITLAIAYAIAYLAATITAAVWP